MEEAKRVPSLRAEVLLKRHKSFLCIGLREYMARKHDALKIGNMPMYWAHGEQPTGKWPFKPVCIENLPQRSKRTQRLFWGEELQGKHQEHFGIQSGIVVQIINMVLRFVSLCSL